MIDFVFALVPPSYATVHISNLIVSSRATNLPIPHDLPSYLPGKDLITKSN